MGTGPWPPTLRGAPGICLCCWRVSAAAQQLWQLTEESLPYSLNKGVCLPREAPPAVCERTLPWGRLCSPGQGTRPGLRQGGRGCCAGFPHAGPRPSRSGRSPWVGAAGRPAERGSFGWRARPLGGLLSAAAAGEVPVKDPSLRGVLVPRYKHTDRSLHILFFLT